MPIRTILAALLLTLGASAHLGAQNQPLPRDSVSVAGHVVDRTTGRDLPSVRIVFTPSDSTAEELAEEGTDSEGRFDAGSLPLGTYLVTAEALAFSDVSRTMTFSDRGSVELRIEMSPEALDLEPIVVASTRLAWLADRGFYERRERGMGYTLTRAEIDRRNPYLASDIFFSIPGADVISERTGSTPAYVLLRNRCRPQLVVDGAPFSAPVPIDQVVRPEDIEAVEVYHGSSAPARYQNSTCGTILVWTRRAAPDEGSPVTWKRVLAVFGLVGWFAFSVR